MEAIAILGPQIGIAASCVALSINRAGIYRARARLARPHWCTFPRKRRVRPPLAFSEDERTVLLLILNSERFADLAPVAMFAILLDEGRYHGSIRTMYRLLWVFAMKYSADGTTDSAEIFRAPTIAIRRHVKIPGASTPFDPEWTAYLARHRAAKRSVKLSVPISGADEWLEPDAG